MSRRFWKRLAGCIAISGSLAAATPEYRAGAAATDHVRAVVVEDRRGARAVFAEADFPITRAVSDFVAVQLLKSYGLDRAAIAISGTGSAAEEPAAILSAIGRALGALQPAAISGAISIRSATGSCIATLYPIRLDGCRNGRAVSGTIRAAFRMIDLPHPLQRRDTAPRAYPIQAVAIGKVTLLALSGEVPAGAHGATIVVGHANATEPYPGAPAIGSAIDALLAKVR
jgi:hypothetical protein